MTGPWAPLFTDDELTCRCGCGRMEVDQDFMRKLLVFRERIGVVMPVTSGYRCPDHNEDESTTGRNGPHVRGQAVDILISHELAARLLRHAFNYGFIGIGAIQHGDVTGRNIHLDMTPRRYQTFWTY